MRGSNPEAEAAGKTTGGNRLNKAFEHLAAAYAWLSKVPVSGEGVDFLAMARKELRAARQAAAEDQEASNG